jgi:hypothetical protein
MAWTLGTVTILSVLHDVQTDAGHAGVGLVVDEQVAAVVAAVRVAHVGVVGITVGEAPTVAHDALDSSVMPQPLALSSD